MSLSKREEVNQNAVATIFSVPLVLGASLLQHEACAFVNALEAAGFTICGPDEVPMPKGDPVGKVADACKVWFDNVQVDCDPKSNLKAWVASSISNYRSMRDAYQLSRNQPKERT